MLSNTTHQLKSTVELGYMCPRGLTGLPAGDQVVEMYKGTFTKIYTPF